LKSSSPSPSAKPITGHRALLFISLLSIGLGLAGGIVAPVLMKLIGFVTNISFYGKLSSDFSSPAENHLGLWVIIVPAIGGIIVGIMARFGSRAIRGHGIPEAMEQVLEGNSRIPARITILKPISAAFAIGTGGPFGAEGPIIATGGALGSLVGQVLSTTGAERKTLLAAGAAAGMAATFGSPVSAVLLAVELLLFEFRARSLIPVALAAAVAAGMRIKFMGAEAIFSMPEFAPVGLSALALYAVVGIVIGVAAVIVTRIVYWLEDMFEHLPVHWMWWPAIGGLAVGIVGYFAPHTLGVGYDNIADILSNRFTIHAIAFLCVMKFISWSISLSSGTSGGTLAPLFTIGSGAGAALGALLLAIFPASGLDIRVAALVRMAGIFHGPSRALLASVIFAFETTHQPNGLLPLLIGATLAYLVARMLMQNSIMTEKIARRGLRIPEDYDADVFLQTNVEAVMDKNLKALSPDMPVSELANRIAHHDPEVSVREAWPLVGPDKQLAGIITRNDVIRSLEKPGPDSLKLREVGSPNVVTAFPDETVHEAVARMLTHNIGRLLVVDRADPKQLIGYVSRTHLLSTRFRQVQQERIREEGWIKKRSIK